MPIPDYQRLMLPLLKVLADQKEHRTKDAIEILGKEFKLSEDEKSELLSGGQPVFNNRVGWARTYLKKAGLLDNSIRGIIFITERGLKVLAEKPKSVNVKYLKKFSEFLEFIAPSALVGEKDTITLLEENVQTPEEAMDGAYNEIRRSLVSELLNKIMSMPPVFFERLVVDLLVKMGYGGSIKDAGKAIGKTGDGGIDGIIKQDKLGLDIIYIQAKRWQAGNTVGQPEIQKFAGALAGHGAKKGVFITTSSFTKAALGFILKNDTKLVLIDGDTLTQYMIDYDLGVISQRAYELKRMDIDYFGED